MIFEAGLVQYIYLKVLGSISNIYGNVKGLNDTTNYIDCDEKGGIGFKCRVVYPIH